MSELSEDETENFSDYKAKQRAYIKTKTLHGNTIPIIHTSLKEVLEMQHWTEVLFNGGINILGKEEWAQKTTHSLVTPLQRSTTQALLSSTHRH